MTIQIDVNVNSVGEELSLTLGTFAIAIDGSIDIIVGPEAEIQTTVAAVVTKADANVFPTGIQLSPNLGNVDIDLNTPVDVTGEELTTTLGSVMLFLA
jgi:hypothetical protein